MSKKQNQMLNVVGNGFQYVGIDVSHLTLDVYYELHDKHSHCVLINKKENIVEFCQKLGAAHPELVFHFVLEFTGTYSDLLMNTLHELNLRFSVITPKKSHSFMLSENMTNITDKQAAKMLYKFGLQKQPEVYKMPTKDQTCLKQLLSALDDLKKELQMLNNQQHAMAQLVNPHAKVKAIWEARIAQTEKDIESLETEIEALTEIHFAKMIENIQTIPCVGKKTATTVVIATQGFQNCGSAKSAAKFIGLCPTQADSGTSVRKAKHIPLAGIGAVKSCLFNCARAAMRFNPELKAFYDKLKQNGKSSKVALTAVMHKIIRIIYAVATSNQPYQENFNKTKNFS